MKIKPLGDRIIVTRVEEEKTSVGGIVIPDTAREKPIQGLVKAVGPGKVLEDGSRRAPDIEVGERVLFGKFAGTEVKLGGEELLILREEDVMGVVEV